MTSGYAPDQGQERNLLRCGAEVAEVDVVERHEAGQACVPTDEHVGRAGVPSGLVSDVWRYAARSSNSLQKL